MTVKFAYVEEDKCIIQGRKVKEIRLLDNGTILLVLEKESE